MNHEEFKKVFEDQMHTCADVLIMKATEYAHDADRLHNFRVAAELKQTTMRNALDGMLAKHVISIFDMTRSGDSYTTSQWDEKITDAINYLILLKAVVFEELFSRVSESEPPIQEHHGLDSYSA